MQLPSVDNVPPTLKHPAAGRFWLVLLGTAVIAGLGAAALTRLLEFVQRLVWGGTGTDLLASVEKAPALSHVLALISAGVITGIGQFLLRRLSSGNGIDTTAAIWFYGGRLPSLRTIGSAVLSVLIVGMGASLGREGAPKQVGAVAANFLSDYGRLSDEQRRLIVACGSGAGMAGAYGVPMGGALFSLEVMRGVLALRFALPALLASIVATAVAWLFLPDAPTYAIPAYASSWNAVLGALLVGPIAGVFSVGYVRLITWAERNKPENWRRFVVPLVGLGLIGLVSVRFPQVLGNGRDVSQLAFANQVPLLLLMILVMLRPVATALCIRCGAPGGLFTPSLTTGAMLGGLLGTVWSWFSPGTPVGLFALLGAGAVLAAATQGPISTIVLLMEMTGRDRSFILPLLLAATTATLVARSIEPRSIYDARLTDQELAMRQRQRDALATPSYSGRE